MDPIQGRQLDRFAKVLGEIAQDPPEDCDADLALARPRALRPEVAARLLRISRATPPAPTSLRQRLAAWLDRILPRRRFLAAALAPVATALLCILGLGPKLWQGSIAPYTLIAVKTIAPHSPDGQVILGGPLERVQSTRELTLSRQDMLTVVLRPQTPQRAATAVRAFVARNDQLIRWDVDLEGLADGSFRLHLPVRALPELQPRQELLFAIARPSDLPIAEQLRADQTQRAGRYHLYRLKLTLSDSAGAAAQ